MTANAARYALLIGCNYGGGDVEQLQWAESDAQRFGVLLTSLGGFDRSATVTLLHPDSAGLDKELRKTASMVRMSKTPGNDLFLLYYSGHADGRDILLGTDRYPLMKIQSYLDSLPAAIRIGIFDACQSGAVTAYKGGKRAEPFYLTDQQKIKGEVIIASTAANERAQESESLKGSIFSFYWQNGLRGSADASGDRRVTLDEAYRYAYCKTVETSTLTGGEAQHPMYRFNIHGEGEITLTDLTEGSGGISFDRSCEGKFLVLSDSYTDIFADFSKKRNSETFVSLDPGSYTVINANNGEVGMYSFTVGESAAKEVRLSQSMLVPNQLTESRIKGVNAVAGAKMSTPATSPLSTYTWGAGTGALATLAAGGSGAPRMLVASFDNAVYLREHADLFFNFYYLTGGLNFGSDIGFDYVWGPRSSAVVTGIGGGLYYFDKKGLTFDNAVSPSLTGHVGFTTDIGANTRFVVQVPYTVVFGSTVSHRIGVELRLMFSGKYQDVKVLHY
jgi:Caspase domain